ncbi:MAG: C40 family peptidase, partial [Propionibacteriaceae bacterium]|nr:C40 family peptidase [Propionibacteriaceae bacterium]
LEIDAAAIDDQAVGVQERLDAGTKKLTVKQADVAQQVAKVARIRIQVGQVALAQFQNRNLDTTAQLFFTEDTEGFLSQISTIEKVAENQNTLLQDFQAQQAQLADLERSAKVDVAALQAQGRELARLRKASDDKMAESKAVLARLTEEERQRIAAEERAAAEAARKAAEAADAAAAAEAARLKAATPETSTKSTTTTKAADQSDAGQQRATRTVQSTGKGAVAASFAKRQLGKPYRYAGNGPDAYDCSGLTSAAWRAAGVSIPRTSAAQSGSGQVVARSELRPGDLVFFYSPVSHVGIYVGNGVIINSPRPGKVVGYTNISRMPYAGARRPG